MTSITRDTRFAVKLLLKNRAFTISAVLTLALCIGANTAIFSVLNSVLLKPLPFEGANRLVRIYNSYPVAGVERGGAAAPDYFDRRELPALESVAMATGQGMTIGESGRPERVRGRAVTPSFFELLGVAPVVGRTFLPEEGEPEANRVAVLSWGLWQERYGGAGDVAGSTIRINDVTHTIVGVMPRNFVFEDSETRLWVPIAFTAAQRGDNARHSNNWDMIARLRPGSTVAQAQQQIDALNAQIAERLPQLRELLSQVGYRAVVVDYRADTTRDVRGTLLLLQAGVIVVLLIGCINIANLVLVRSTARHRELATRAALGAGRRRLATQMLTESIVLALLGGIAGVLVGWAAVRAFARFATTDLPRSVEIGMDPLTLLVSLAVAGFAGVLFGAMPVARLLHADLSTVFRDEGRSGTAGRTTGTWRSALVVAQVSLAFALLVGAGLMLVSFARTLDVDPGFDAADVVTARLPLPVTRYPDAQARRTFAAQLLERVRALPGVQYAAVTSMLPFGGEMNASAVTPEGFEPRADDPLIAPVNTLASTDYFDAMGIDVVAGRAFTEADAAGALPVAMVDRYLAERFWPGADPIGKRLGQGVATAGDEIVFRTVVGVVEDVRVASLTGDQPLGHFYIPAAQQPTAQPFLVVRTSLPLEAVAGPLRRVVLELDPDLPLADVRPLGARLADSVATERLRMLLLVGFGGLALFLAAIGLYGVLAYSVTQRSAEIGIRMALGSSARAVFTLILRQGAKLVGLGLGLGVIGSIAAGRMLQSMLYGVRPNDPFILASVLAVLAVTGVVACILPARRAMRVDPMIAIREGT
jgi:putative ABC transport system permease protein